MKQLINRGEQYTTIKELATILKVDDTTIRRAIKKLFPNLLQKGIKTYINEFEATKIKQYIMKNKHLPNIGRTAEVSTNLEKYETIKKGWQYLNEMIAELQQENKMLKPKADYFDEIVARNLLTNFRDTAKELHIGQKRFIEWLLLKGYIYRDKKGKLKPYQKYVNEGLFELKEWANDKKAGNQCLITPKGKETFRILINY